MNTKNILASILVTLTCSGLLFGCNSKNDEADKYELSPPTKDGGVYRLNKESGEVVFISETTSKVLQGPGTFQEATNVVKIWSEVKVPSSGNSAITLRTKWRDGKLYCELTMTPYEQIENSIKNSSPSPKLWIEFRDADGFETLVVPVDLRDLSEDKAPVNWDSNGKIAKTVDLGGVQAAVACDLKTYQSLAFSSISCSGF